MRTTIDGHQVRTEPCDGLKGHHRVFADGRFAGLVVVDQANNCYTLPATAIGGPVCHAPTCRAAIATLIVEAFR
jgi:hypothetical protein